MTQARSRTVHGDLPAAAVGQPAPQEVPGQVVLADGRTIKLRRLNGLDSATLEQAMEEAGFTQIAGPGKATHLRCTAAYAIQEENGQLITPPAGGPELRARLAGYLEEDWGAILTGYLRLTGALPAQPQNGAGASDATFS